MKQHTGMEAHDGFAPHSHEVRPDHLGVAVDIPRTGAGGIIGPRDADGFPIPKGWAVYHDGHLVLRMEDWTEIGRALIETMES